MCIRDSIYIAARQLKIWGHYKKNRFGVLHYRKHLQYIIVSYEITFHDSDYYEIVII